MVQGAGYPQGFEMGLGARLGERLQNKSKDRFSKERNQKILVPIGSNLFFSFQDSVSL